MKAVLRSSALLVVLIAQCVVNAQQTGQKPDFKANVDYVEIPVRVLDSKGRFVRGLTQSDLAVLEDGERQRIVSVSFVDAPVRRDVSSTVETTPETPTTVSITQSYIVVLDDYHIRREDTFKTRSLVLDFLRQYVSRDDAVGIVFTSGAKGQTLTRDRSVLSSAVDRLRGQFDPTEPAALQETKAVGVIKTIGDISRAFADDTAGLRKAILLVTAGVGCLAATAPSNTPGVPWCGSVMTETLRAAARSDVVVYSIDPRGSRNPAWVGPTLGPRGGTGALIQSMRAGGESGSNLFDAMHTLANETGGFSVAGTDGFAKAFNRIVSDFSEYYLLGYYSGRRDIGGALRRNEVRVSRSGTRAFYRRTYIAPR